MTNVMEHSGVLLHGEFGGRGGSLCRRTDFRCDLPNDAKPWHKVLQTRWCLDDGTVVELREERFYCFSHGTLEELIYDWYSRYTLTINGNIVAIDCVEHYDYDVVNTVTLLTTEGELVREAIRINWRTCRHSASWCERELTPTA